MSLFVQESAEQDILAQVEWYAEQGVPHIAPLFVAAVRQAIAALVDTPGAGAPIHLDNPRLAGLRSWPIKRFPESRVYYLATPRLTIIVRVLHGKRDTGAILESQDIEPHPKAQ